MRRSSGQCTMRRLPTDTRTSGHHQELSKLSNATRGNAVFSRFLVTAVPRPLDSVHGFAACFAAYGFSAHDFSASGFAVRDGFAEDGSAPQDAARTTAYRIGPRDGTVGRKRVQHAGALGFEPRVGRESSRFHKSGERPSTCTGGVRRTSVPAGVLELGALRGGQLRAQLSQRRSLHPEDSPRRLQHGQR